MARSKATGNGNQRFARWFVKARTEAQLTQEQIAEKMGVSQSAIFDWEHRGLETMLPATVRELARALDVEPVEVAEALGYPTRPRATVTLPISADEWMRQISELNDRVQQATERWAQGLFPPQSQEHKPNGRTG